MKIYKLTDENNKTANDTVWGENVTHEVTGELSMCKNGLHAYKHPLMAVFMNSAHADIIKPVLWEAKGKIELDDGCKVLCRKLTTIRKIELPEITIKQRIRISIRIAQYASSKIDIDKESKTYRENIEKWQEWANDYLEGKTAARAVAWAARAANAAADAAADAARAAARDAADLKAFTKKFIEILEEECKD